MSNVPSTLKYTKSHEWIRVEDDGTLTIGVTDHAQEALGDIVFLELPEAGRALSAGEACAVIESVKAASDIYAPVTGEVVAGNASLGGQPELINSDPYGAGWIMRVRPDDKTQFAAMLDAKATRPRSPPRTASSRIRSGRSSSGTCRSSSPIRRTRSACRAARWRSTPAWCRWRRTRTAWRW